VGPRLPLVVLAAVARLEGYRVSRGLGVVRGITVRSRSIFGTIGGALETTLAGGN